MKMTPGEFAMRLQRIPAAIRKAEGESILEAYKMARGPLSSGPLSSKVLEAMGHPYGHGRTPPLPPQIINRQTGLFQQSWRFNLPRDSGGALVGSIENNAPYAGYLEHGTAKMIARPLPRAVARYEAPRRLARLSDYIERALKR